MPTFDSPAEAVQAGELYIKNADDAIGQKVIREDQLYKWENQLQAIDLYLADTEDLEGEGVDKLMDVRTEARLRKVQLETNIAEFFEEPVEDEDPATNALALLEVGAGLMDEAEDVLGKKIETIEDAAFIEDALIGLKQWLSDSEPYRGNEVMDQARTDVKQMRDDLQAKLDDLVAKWKEMDEDAD